MKTYSCPHITVNLCNPADIMALSIIIVGSADQDIPVQVKEQNTFFKDWSDIFADGSSD